MRRSRSALGMLLTQRMTKIELPIKQFRKPSSFTLLQTFLNLNFRGRNQLKQFLKALKAGKWDF